MEKVELRARWMLGIFMRRWSFDIEFFLFVSIVIIVIEVLISIKLWSRLFVE